MREYGFDFRGEDEHVVDDRVVERIDPEMISREQQLALFSVEQCKGKLAIEFVDEIDAIFLVKMGEHFDVAAGAERVPFFNQGGSQLAIVVDLAITNYDDGFVFIEEGLVAAFEVDDAQPAKAETDIVRNEVARRIRPAMNELVGHFLQQT